MTTAYIDSSVVVAVMLDEPSGPRFTRHLNQYDNVVSATLLEAEVLAVAKRNGLALDPVCRELDHITLVTPERSLAGELCRIFVHGYCRGPDALHLATALYLDPTGSELVFVSADRAQGRLASRLGFTTPLDVTTRR